MDWLKNRLDASAVDWVSYRNVAGAVSGALVVLSVLVFVVVGPNWGIDFTGGTEIQVAFDEPLEIGDVRDALKALDIPSDAVQEVGGDGVHAFKIRIKDAEFGAAELKADVVEALKAGKGADWVADWDADVRFSAEVGARFSVRYQGDRVLPEELAPYLAGIEGAKVTEGREDNELVVKLPGLSTQIEEVIASAMGDRTFEVQSVDAVGPKVGESLRQQGFASIFATLGLVLLYIAFRFDLTFAPGAIVALIHDVTLTVGVFVVLGQVVPGMEFNLPIIGALLTIVGYSLNDTIVIYDRIRENGARYSREQTGELINTSINETLSRTIATSFTTFLAIAPFLFLGSAVIRDFVLAMLCGIVFGTYSTIFVASPMILVMEKVKPKLVALVALDDGSEDIDEGDDIPEQFLSESEKRRRERERLEKAQRDDEDV